MQFTWRQEYADADSLIEVNDLIIKGPSELLIELHYDFLMIDCWADSRKENMMYIVFIDALCKKMVSKDWSFKIILLRFMSIFYSWFNLDKFVVSPWVFWQEIENFKSEYPVWSSALVEPGRFVGNYHEL